jgi:hypothetical protein
MTEYKLVNPHIEGNFKKLVSGKTPFDAAKNTWTGLSSNFTSCVPAFGFTIERVKDNKMFHYKVKESVKNDNVEFKITELNLKLSADNKKKFNDKLSTFKSKIKSQNGGGKKKDEDDSSDSEFYDLYHLNNHALYNSPISYFWYYPEFYTFDHDWFFMPTFTSTSTPYVFLNYPSYPTKYGW